MAGRHPIGSRYLASVLVAALIVSACGTPTPSPVQTATASPTRTPVATPTEVPSASAPIARATGGMVEVAGGPTLSVPAGGVAADTTATIRASAASVPGESDEWPATPLGPAWDIDLDGQSLTATAELTFRWVVRVSSRPAP